MMGPIERQNVAVDVSFDYSGHMIPTTIHDKKGELHWIERIVSVQPAIYACNGCGRGERYTVLSEGKTKNLCFEQLTDPFRDETGRWFLEEEHESSEEHAMPPEDQAGQITIDHYTLLHDDT